MTDDSSGCVLVKALRACLRQVHAGARNAQRSGNVTWCLPAAGAAMALVLDFAERLERERRQRRSVHIGGGQRRDAGAVPGGRLDNRLVLEEVQGKMVECGYLAARASAAQKRARGGGGGCLARITWSFWNEK